MRMAGARAASPASPLRETARRTRPSALQRATFLTPSEGWVPWRVAFIVWLRSCQLAAGKAVVIG